MSTDRRVTTDLIETLEGGEVGFARAAEKLADSDRPELSARIRTFSEQLAGFASGLGRGRCTDAAEQGEDHAESDDQDALYRDISAELRSVVERQFLAVQQRTTRSSRPATPTPDHERSPVRAESIEPLISAARS
jgi:hypothetical protein